MSEGGGHRNSARGVCTVGDGAGSKMPQFGQVPAIWIAATRDSRLDAVAVALSPQSVPVTGSTTAACKAFPYLENGKRVAMLHVGNMQHVSNTVPGACFQHCNLVHVSNTVQVPGAGGNNHSRPDSEQSHPGGRTQLSARRGVIGIARGGYPICCQMILLQGD